MSKKVVDPPQLTECYFTLKRLSEGWAVFKITIQGDKIISKERVTEPDMFPIASSKVVTAIKESQT